MKPASGPPPAVIYGVGLCTPLGLSARVSTVEIAAGAVRFQETQVPDTAGVPVRASLLNRIRRGRKRADRINALAGRAIAECGLALEPTRRWRVPLFLGLPAPKSGGMVALDALTAKLQSSVGSHVQLDIADQRYYPSGRAAFFEALAAAMTALEGAVPLAIVGAVDSSCDETTLTYLAALGRTLGPLNPDGVIPGEGAGFVLLGRDGVLPAGPRPRVLACAVAQEPRHFLQEEPLLGEGLTRVFATLRKHPTAGTPRADWMLSCQTGETFWGREFTMAALRNADLMPEPLDGQLVAESLGDVGAASGAIQLVVADAWLRQRSGQKPPPRILIHGSSDEGLVGGCIVAGG